MPAHCAGRCRAAGCVDGYQRVGATADQLAAIRAPVDIVERGGVALQHARTLAACAVPHPQHSIPAAAQQAAIIGREGEPFGPSGMPAQYRAIAATFNIPQPDRLVAAATCESASIWAPDHTAHLIGMSDQRLEQMAARCVCTERS